MLINSNQFLFLKLYIIKIKPNNIQNRSLKNGPVIKKKGNKLIIKNERILKFIFFSTMIYYYN